MFRKKKTAQSQEKSEKEKQIAEAYSELNSVTNKLQNCARRCYIKNMTMSCFSPDSKECEHQKNGLIEERKRLIEYMAEYEEATSKLHLLTGNNYINSYTMIEYGMEKF